MDKNKDTNKFLESQAGGGLSDDLKKLFAPPPQDFSAVDRAVMDRAAQRLLLIRKGRRLFKPAAAIGAAAAVIIVGVLLFNRVDDSGTEQSFAASVDDVDRNGSVDILDAFQLAKLVESSASPDLRWDKNGDGVVDRRDIDIIAQAAVLVRKDML